MRVWLLAAALVLLGGGDAAAGLGPPEGHRQILAGTWLHAPVADDDCTVCHTMHRGPVGPNLQAPVPELCYECHENVAARDVVHEPVGEGRCTDCHRVHSSEHRPLLVQRVPELCLGCHPVDAAHVARGTVCTSCHEVHSSETYRFLKGERTRNCGRCHADKRQGLSLHPPARDGKCLTCHFTHPDPRFKGPGLREPYARTVFAPYRPDAYVLCDRCHPRGLHADSAFLDTGFRDRDRNLHRVHVARERGVTCSACHDVHASDREALIRNWIRWPDREPQLMGFIRFSTGGTCGPSCHAEATYLREWPPEEGEEPR